jgi:hypothetical protein
MAEAGESLRNKLIEIVVQTLIFGALLAGLGFWLNLRLETYKKELADDTERLKAALQSNAPLIQQRRAAYLELQQAARELNRVLEVHYFRAKEPSTGQVMRNKLRALEDDMGIGSSGSRGGWFVSKGDVVGALRRMVSLSEKYEDISSGTISSAVDDFLETVMADVREAEQKENDTESFHTAARVRLKDALSRLDHTITQALRLDELPIK